MNGHQPYTIDMLIKLYKAAQLFNMPVIEELYKQQFNEATPKAQFELVVRLKLPDPDRTAVFQNIPYGDFKEIAAMKKFPFYLSLEEYAIILAKQTACVNCEKKRKGWFH